MDVFHALHGRTLLETACRVVCRTLLSQHMRGGEGDKSGRMGRP